MSFYSLRQNPGVSSGPDDLGPIEQLIRNEQFDIRFQPVFALGDGRLVAHTVQVLAPPSSGYPNHLLLRAAANQSGRRVALDRITLWQATERFSQSQAQGDLILPLSPESLQKLAGYPGGWLEWLHKHDLPPVRLVLMVDIAGRKHEHSAELAAAGQLLAAHGFRLGCDDVGVALSALNLWQSLAPHWLIIGAGFLNGVENNPIKGAILRTLVDTARKNHANVIADTSATAEQLQALHAAGVEHVQADRLAGPAVRPLTQSPPDVVAQLSSLGASTNISIARGACARDLLQVVPSVEQATSNGEIQTVFERHPEWSALAVVQGQRPVGLLRRQRFLEAMLKPGAREQLAAKDCVAFTDRGALIVDGRTGISEVSDRLFTRGETALADGFIITEGGNYIGLGSGYELMRRINDLRISAARYANPLTGLPGNVPTNECLDALLNEGLSFVAAYADLDYFKPFNDIYGYRKGDALIILLGEVLTEILGENDYIGHIGGDDFVMVMQSEDWAERCQLGIDNFNERAKVWMHPEHIEAGGFTAQDRQGNTVFNPLTRLSIGAVVVDPMLFSSHHDIAEATADAKKMAKKKAGLFIERRRYIAPEAAPPPTMADMANDPNLADIAKPLPEVGAEGVVGSDPDGLNWPNLHRF